jgi:hypothetical protein
LLLLHLALSAVRRRRRTHPSSATCLLLNFAVTSACSSSNTLSYHLARHPTSPDCFICFWHRSAALRYFFIIFVFEGCLMMKT